MNRSRIVLLIAAFAAVAFGTAWDWNCGGPTQQLPWFTVSTSDTVNGINQLEGNVPISGFSAAAFYNCGQNPDGHDNFSASTNSRGTYRLEDAAVPCIWSFTRYPTQLCPALSSRDYYMGAGYSADVHCAVPARTFTAVPSGIDLSDPPSTLQVQGPDLNASAAYGMPVVRIYDQDGQLRATGYASSVAGDGTYVNVGTGFLGSLYTDVYAVLVFNVQADGSIQAIGGAELDIYGNDPPPPPPECTDHICPDQQ